MNQQILKFIETHLSQEEVAGKTVIELGSRYVNGSARFIVEKLGPAAYTGVDLREGPCVDLVLPLERIFERFQPGSFDIVIATELLQHVEDFRVAINTLKKLLKTGGLLLVSTRSPGYGYCGYPVDLWRYELADFQTLFSDMQILNLEDDRDRGILLKARKETEALANIDGHALFNVVANARIKANPAFTSGFMAATASGARPGGNYFAACDKLEKTGFKYGTDKTAHGYLRKYEFFLKKFADEQFNLLELGVLKGASLRMWADYFKNARIYGCDITPGCFMHSNERIFVHILNLDSVRAYATLAQRRYRVIVDDASHLCSHQIMSLLYLFPALEPGGIFIMEDLHTNFKPLLTQYMGQADDTAANMLARLATLVVSQNAAENPGHYDVALRSMAKEIDMITFIQKSCLIVKR